MLHPFHRLGGVGLQVFSRFITFILKKRLVYKYFLDGDIVFQSSLDYFLFQFFKNIGISFDLVFLIIFL